MTTRLLRSGEVARIFGVSIDSVGKWVHAGRLPASRTTGGQFRFTVEDVRALMVAQGYPLDRLDSIVLR